MRFTGLRFGKLFSLFAALAIFAAGCSDSNEPNGDTQLRLINSTGSTILFVYYSDCDDQSWGDDRLDDDETIADGDDRFFDVDPGCYDLRADLAGGGSETLFGVQIDEDETFEWTVVD